MQAGGRTDPMDADFSEVNGQQFGTGSGNRSVRNAQYAAGAGNHDFRANAAIPPPLQKEQLEVSKIYSVCGCWQTPDTVAGTAVGKLHHTSRSRLAGGGRSIRPGEDFTGTS